jgi:electron transfer flavoprotein alpha subunit
MVLTPNRRWYGLNTSKRRRLGQQAEARTGWSGGKVLRVEGNQQTRMRESQELPVVTEAKDGKKPTSILAHVTHGTEVRSRFGREAKTAILREANNKVEQVN